MIPASVPKGSARGRADFLRGLRRPLDPEVVPQAEVHRRQNPDPAVGQFVALHQRRVLHDAAAKDARGRQEQDKDRHEGDRGDDKVEGQRRQNPAIVQPGEEHDDQDDERSLVQFARIAGHRRDDVDQVARGDRVRRLQHRVGEGQVQPDVEGHQRPDDVLGLRVLAACRRDGRGHLGVDHRDAGVEDAREPAGDQRRIGAALADREVPAHVFADQNDADAQGPDMRRAKDAQQAHDGSVRTHAVHGLRCDIGVCHDCAPQVLCSSVRASSSPSRDEVRTSSEYVVSVLSQSATM
jgi:hypothetical protein